MLILASNIADKLSNSIAPLMWTVFLYFLTKSTISIFKMGISLRANLVSKDDLAKTRTEMLVGVSTMKQEITSMLMTTFINIIDEKTKNQDKIPEIIMENKLLRDRLDNAEKELKNAKIALEEATRVLNGHNKVSMMNEPTRRQL